MRLPWLSAIMFIAALAIGYSILSRRDAGFDTVSAQPSIHGYYLKRAIITETSDTGAPRARFAANEVTQDVATHRMMMSAVRADYVWPGKEQVNHWVLDADRVFAPDVASEKKPLLELRGNVEARSVGTGHDAELSAAAIDIDTDTQIARSQDIVTVAVDGHVTRGTDMVADLAQHRVRMADGVTLQPTAQGSPAGALTLPEIFEFKQFDYNNDVLTLTQVRSKSEPFVSADQARATGADVANNQWVLRGNVRMELPKRGLLTADVADITVRNGRVVRAKVSGAPVTFRHSNQTSGQTVNGRAQTIEYDVPTQTLRFMGEAWFNNGQFEITSDFIEYDLATESAHGSRVEGTVLPRQESKTQ